jgi:hypothetical protein
LFNVNRYSSSLAIDDITGSINDENARIAYVYFDYKNREEHTGENVIRTLLKQILLPSKLIPPDLKSAYDNFTAHHKYPDISIFTRQLLSISATLSSVYIILDALDECSSETLNDILSLVHQFKNYGVRVFCTSRPHITNLRDKLETPTILINANNEDIRNYLTIRVNKGWRHDKRFQGTIIDKLTQGAKGK